MEKNKHYTNTTNVAPPNQNDQVTYTYKIPILGVTRWHHWAYAYPSPAVLARVLKKVQQTNAN